MGIDTSGVAPVNPGGVQLPAYYNPGAINVNRYADQVQKRKLIWGHKTNEAQQAAKWAETAKFSGDGKVANKFMRLMGVKGGGKLKKIC